MYIGGSLSQNAGVEVDTKVQVVPKSDDLRQI